MSIEIMGKYTAIGMRVKAPDSAAAVISTCSQNDTSEIGSASSWTWCNPTNRIIPHTYCDLTAVSVECLWQGTKIREGMTQPDPAILNGAWRLGKGKRPLGAWSGAGAPLITNPGEARRTIYLPAFRNLVRHWLQDETVRGFLRATQALPGNIMLRDHDTGRGLDRNGPMSHAWVLASFLNTNGVWPDGVDDSVLLKTALQG